MEKQPFLLVVLEGGQSKIINEAHVVSVEKRDKGHAYLRMSNGDEIIIKNYDEWENDCHARH